MTTQAIVRSIGNGRRSMAIDFGLTLVGQVNAYGRRFCVRFYEAMDESRRRRAAEIIRQHRGLNDLQ